LAHAQLLRQIGNPDTHWSRQSKEREQEMKSDANKMLTESSRLPAFKHNAITTTRQCGRYAWLLMPILAVCFTATARAQQITYYSVDCTGANPYAYPTINAALTASAASPGSFILVTGPCTENVNINSAFNLSIGAFYGQTANLVGGISVSDSESVYFYGLNVSNPSGDGFYISSSRGVTLDTCTSNGNQGHGLHEDLQSEVSGNTMGSFDNNGASGVYLNEASVFGINSWQGPTDISNNVGQGVWLSVNSVFTAIGNTTINNNAVPISSTNTVPVFGVTALGHSVVQLGTCEGPNAVQGNQAGGFDIEESSELSIFDCGTSYQNNVLNNGPTGISAGFGSQVTLYEMAAISGHTAQGVELYGNSQLNVEGDIVISNNGAAGESRSAGIVVDGNSEAYFRGGQLSANHGPGVLVLVNSSIDFTGTKFDGNTGGPIRCDSSGYMVTDELAGNRDGGAPCPIPHHLGNRHSWPRVPTAPDLTALKAKHTRYIKLASGKPH